MKKYLILGLTIAIIAIILMTNVIISKNKEIKRVKHNYEIEKTNHANQLDYKTKELEKYEKENIKLAKELGIKPKHITHLSEKTYYIHDTLIIESKTILIDTLKMKYSFDIDYNCFNAKGNYWSDTIRFTNISLTDTIIDFFYRDYEKKYLWGLIKCGEHFTMKSYSKCKKDTIKVNKNIKVLK